jgi:hypothetical protein
VDRAFHTSEPQCLNRHPIVIREASHDDNAQLLALTEQCPMQGSVGVLIDRKPDFFSLLRLKGEFKAFIAVTDNRIVGSFALVVKRAYIHRVPEYIGYLCDMKILPSFRRSRVAYLLMRAMNAYMRTLPINLYLCVISQGNRQVESLLQGRAGIPAPEKTSHFHVFHLFPRKKDIDSGKPLHAFAEFYRNQIISLLNQYYRDFEFASVFAASDAIEGDVSWVALENGKVSAFISLTDTSACKQNIVIRIPRHLKILLHAARLFWPGMKLPQEGAALRILNVKYLAFSPDARPLALLLIHRARHYAFANQYAFLSYGMDRRNRLARDIKSIPGVIFKSVGYVFNFGSEDRWANDVILHDNFYQV